MIKLLISEIDFYNYTFYDDDDNEYALNIEFRGLSPSVGDVIYMSKDVLKEEVPLTFGPMKEKSDSKDYLKLIHNDSEIYLQRYYG